MNGEEFSDIGYPLDFWSLSVPSDHLKSENIDKYVEEVYRFVDEFFLRRIEFVPTVVFTDADDTLYVVFRHVGRIELTETLVVAGFLFLINYVVTDSGRYRLVATALPIVPVEGSKLPTLVVKSILGSGRIVIITVDDTTFSELTRLTKASSGSAEVLKLVLERAIEYKLLLPSDIFMNNLVEYIVNIVRNEDVCELVKKLALKIVSTLRERYEFQLRTYM